MNTCQLPIKTILNENRYIIERFIEKGTFGEVYKAFDQNEKHYVAIKLTKNVPKYSKISENEKAILDQIHSQNSESKWYIVDKIDEFKYIYEN